MQAEMQHNITFLIAKSWRLQPNVAQASKLMITYPIQNAGSWTKCRYRQLLNTIPPPRRLYHRRLCVGVCGQDCGKTT